jgi:hypothetical protein
VTQPDGKVVLEAHVDTSHVEPELVSGTKFAAERAEKEIQETAGHSAGKSVAKGIDEELGHQGNTFAHTIEKGFKDHKVHVGGDAFDVDKNSIGNTFGKAFRDIESIVEDAFTRGGGSNNGKGPFGFLTESIKDAVGAGFNVSGKSPLINPLIPVFGALGSLIGAVVEGVQGLISVLLGLPTIIGAIGLQVGALFLAFRGVGGAIQNAFAAKTPEDFKKAIEGLTVPAQKFVTTLVPALRLFNDVLTKGAQASFFGALGDKIIPRELKNLQDILYPAINKISIQLGNFVARFATILENPLLKKVVSDYVELIYRWLYNFEPALNHFVAGLLDFIDGMMPLANAIGAMVIKWLHQLGDWFFKMGNDSKFQDWLVKNLSLFGDFVDLLLQAGKFIDGLIISFDRAGGAQLFGPLMGSLKMLTDFFNLPIGQKALLGLIHLLEILLFLFDGLVIAIGETLAALEQVGEWLADVVIGWQHIGDSAGIVWKKIHDKFNELIGDVEHWILHFFDGWGDWIFRVGANLIINFVNGMISMFQYGFDAVKNFIGGLADLLPGSPAKKGPLSGSGYTYVRGQHMVKDFARGIRQSMGDVTSSTMNMVNSINFGPGAVRVDFNGAVPTEQQAHMTGSAAGMGIVDQLNQRNVEFAARTL